MAELKPCPFCGTSMKVDIGAYPNGNRRMEPYGWHDEPCPLNHVLWCFDVEDDGWTKEAVVDAWNRRANCETD